MTAEVKGLDASISKASKASKPPPAPSQQDKPPDPKEEKGGKKTPGGKKGKASPSKGKGSPAKGKGAPPPDPVPEAKTPTITPEEVARKQQLLHLWKEHKAAIEHEESTVKLRLELIKGKALELINNLQAKSASMLEEMEQWVGQCYKHEVDSVSSLAEVLRKAVESEEKLLHELKLPGPVFQIEESVVTYTCPPPPSPPPPVEASDTVNFTVSQLLSLHHQFSVIAPSGFMLAHVFVDTLLAFAAKAMGEDLLPDAWCILTREQVERVCEMLYGQEPDFVDWRQFLVCVAHLSPLPSTHQLVDALRKFSERGSGGRVNWEQYQEVGAWFTGQPGTSDDHFDRDEALRKAFFVLFADSSTQLLDYKKMLLYLCADEDPREGLFKALSMVIEEPINPMQEKWPNRTIQLEDFVQVLTHGLYREDKGMQLTMDISTLHITQEQLSPIFEKLGHSSLKEVPVRALLNNSVSLEYMDHCNAYSLPMQDILSLLKAASSTQDQPNTD